MRTVPRDATVGSRSVTDVLIIGDTFRCPEMRHEVPLGVPDPFVYLERDGARHVYVARDGGRPDRGARPDIERAPARGDRRSTSSIARGLALARDPPGGRPRARASHAGLDAALSSRRRSRSATPSACARPASSSRSTSRVFDERRRVKSGAELAGIRRAQRAAEAGNAACVALLRRRRTATACSGSTASRSRSSASRRRCGRCFADARLHGRRVHRRAGAAGGRRARDGLTGRSGAASRSWSTSGRATGESSCFADMTRTFVVGAGRRRACASGTG